MWRLSALGELRAAAGGRDSKLQVNPMKPPISSHEMPRREFLWRGALPAAAVVSGLALEGRLGRLAAADAGRNPFAYDVEKFRKVDPKLVGYERAGHFRCPRPEARRLALGPKDRLHVAAGSQVLAVDERGNVLSELPASGPARALAVSADGMVYVGLKDRVEVYDPKGKRLAQWEPVTGRPFLTGIAVGPRDVFVADAGNRVVLRYDLAGKLVRRIAEKDPQRDIPGLVLPSPFLDVEIAPDGLLRVNNPGRHRVEAYTFNGDLELSWGKPSNAIAGFCGCCNPINLAVLPDNRVVTFEKGLPRVKVYEPDGTFACVVAGPELFGDTAKEESIMSADDFKYGGLDGVVDSQGRVHVLDRVTGEVHTMRRKPTA